MDNFEKVNSIIKKIQQDVDKLLSVNADGLIYHYTSPDVILKILQKKEIWASSVFFLNDRQEVNYTTKLFSEIIDKKYDNKSERKRFYKENFLDRYNEMQEKSFIISFSLDQDSIALWNNYGKNDGYALGFKIIDCVKMFYQESNNLVHSTYFGKTLYDKKKQIEIIELLLDSIDLSYQYYSNEMNPDNRMKIDKINVHLTNKLKATLMTNKGKEHAAENEYRIAIIPDKE